MRQRSRLLSVFNKEQVMHVVFPADRLRVHCGGGAHMRVLVGQRHSHHRGRLAWGTSSGRFGSLLRTSTAFFP